MWHQIEYNKKRSLILIITMLFIMLLLGACLGFLIAGFIFPPNADDFMLLSPQEINIYKKFIMHGTIFAFIVWVIMLLYSFVDGKKAILKLNRAKKIPKGAHRILENVVSEMSIAAGLPKEPEIYIIDCMMPNAFSTGISPKNCAIAVTTGLLTTLDRDELQAVVAHEIAHIVNRDTTYMLFAGVMLGTIVLLSDMAVRNFIGKNSRSSCSRVRVKSSRGGAGGSSLVIIAVAVFVMILAPLMAKLLYFSLSKKREYLADACAVQYTRYPHSLATALAKISGSIYVFRDADKVTSAMYIVHPLDTEILYKNRYSVFGDLFSTHPPTEKRIEILESMIRADFNAYNEAFGKVARHRKTIMTKEQLDGIKPIEIKKPNEGKQSKFDGALVAGTVALAAASASLKNQKENQISEEKIERKREAIDTVWKANDYIFKTCECGIKLKFPKKYEGKEINCPRCNARIKVD